jgi:hypothetical protein
MSRRFWKPKVNEFWHPAALQSRGPQILYIYYGSIRSPGQLSWVMNYLGAKRGIYADLLNPAYMASY